MKTSLLLLAALTTWAVADEEIIPAARTKERFEAMVGKSPFVLATPPEAPKVETKSIFDNMFVKGIGTDYVIIQRVGDDQTMRFWGNEPNEEQIAVKEIRWSEQAGGTTVVMKKGSEEKEIGFNQNELRNPTPPPQPARPPGAPPIPGQRTPGVNNGTANFPRPTNNVPGNIPRPTVQPSMPVPRPNNSAIQMPPPPAGGNNANPASNPNDQGRRRIRVINN